MKYKIIFFLFDFLSNLLLLAKRKPRLLGGPFKGMNYLSSSIGSSLTPKILGTYEKELNDFIEGLPCFPNGIDVGAAEGYYAIGLIKKGICQRIKAWEATEEGRKLLSRLAEMNGIRSSVEICGACTPEMLADDLRLCAGIPTLIVVDCEGYEGPLLENLEISLLADCTLIIETHDMMNPGVHARLLKKLSATHSIVEAAPSKRVVSDLPSSLPLTLSLLSLPWISRAAMSERRCPDIRWLLCTPCTKVPTATP